MIKRLLILELALICFIVLCSSSCNQKSKTQKTDQSTSEITEEDKNGEENKQILNDPNIVQPDDMAPTIADHDDDAEIIPPPQKKQTTSNETNTTIIKTQDNSTGNKTGSFKDLLNKGNSTQPSSSTDSGIKVSTDKTPIKVITDPDVITFGSGGGFTGEAEIYRIYKTGEVMKAKTLDIQGAEEIKKLNPEQIMKIYKDFAALEIEQTKFNHPGNLYFFVGYDQKMIQKRITWGSSDHTVPHKFLSFYEMLQFEINK